MVWYETAHKKRTVRHDVGDDADEVETAQDRAFIDDEDDDGYFGPMAAVGAP